MTSTSFIQRTARQFRRDAPMHLFAIGQSVKLKRRVARSGFAADIYRITGMLPARDGSLQYRIRNDDERHERVTTEDSLEPVDMAASGDGATLIERTFGHGQGTETQQSRDQKTEAGKSAAQA
ncbi:MAG: hypothetical protein M9905_05705 [Rhizobiaceae bacterium]|nr:hypothetical protein [Rhizobiaceae bacterium]